MYIRKRKSDTWHWMPNCSKWPRGTDVVTRATKPKTSELCNECKAKARRPQPKTEMSIAHKNNHLKQSGKFRTSFLMPRP